MLVIDRLHVRAPGRPATGMGPALRLGLEQALRGVHLRPARLRPQAILVIRRLASRATFGPSADDAQRWRQQLEVQVEELAHEALRPGRQYVPPQANSVLFDDEVDLLLCYSRDLLAGRWAWYWEELFPAARPGQPTGRRLLVAWQLHPQAVPKTLVALKPSAAAAALCRLHPADLSRLAHGLHETFSLPRGALDAAVPDTTRPAESESQIPAAAPWGEWLPARQLRGMTPPAAYILGLSYALVRRPQVARQVTFGQEAQRWLESAMAATAPSSLPERHLAVGAARPAAPVALQDGPAASEADLPPASRSPANNWAEWESAAETPTAATMPEADGQTVFDFGNGATTRLAGAIYFVNLMTRLGLPGAIPALADLNPWELLGGLVVALLGPRADDVAADPLWAAIDELAGLEPERPWGASLEESQSFQLPATWLALLPSPPLLARQGPAGIDDWPDLADRLLSPNLTRWVRRLRPFLSQLLARLLGADDPTTAVEALLLQRGTLYVSRTHVDLLQSVEQISIPLRRAGLDKTPGWRPEFGYVISIHFE